MKTAIRALVFGLFGILSAQAAQAHPGHNHPYPGYGPGREVLIGETFLSPRGQDVDWLFVNDCRDGAWDRDLVAVRVEVQAVPADIDSIVLRFGNGQTQVLAIRERFNPWSSTRWVDLEGGRRCIREIRIAGDAEGYNNRQARVSVYGWRSR
jgi:hypothetical protein